MGDWGSVEVARQDFDRWDRERRERRGTWRDSVAWARGIEPCATSAHPDNDGASARKPMVGAAQNDGETHGLRADVAPMLAGASRKAGEVDEETCYCGWQRLTGAACRSCVPPPRTPTRAELLALVERMGARAKEMQRDTITQGHELGRFARELAALLGGCDE